jgi:ATP-dependent Clp protease protease subunit
MNEEVTENILETVILPLRNFENDSSTEEVTLILNTVGGSVADGLALCTVLDTYKKPLKVIVPSYACSMGTLILCAGNHNTNVKKICYPFAFGLFHSGETFVGGESTSVEDIMEFNKGVNAAIRNYVISNTYITPELYDAHNRKQWYISAAEMKALGLIHEIISIGSETND